MGASAKISRDMYRRLGPDGLAARTNASWDERTVRRVLQLLGPRRKVVDLGCGYGRIAIPLARAGCQVVGVDVCPEMLGRARVAAAEAGADVQWMEADICRLPLPDRSFDAAVCLWLTFNELLREQEQLAALGEACRVLRPGGVAVIDGPPFSEAADGGGRGSPGVLGERPVTDDGISRRSPPAAASDPVAARFAALLGRAGNVARHELFVDDCPGRPRYFLRFWTGDGQ